MTTDTIPTPPVEIREFSNKSSEVRLVGVSKVFPTPEGTGETVAVNNIDLAVADGELVTLLGPSGCGKTTTLRMISGFEYPSAGSIFIGDRDVATVPPNRRGIAMVFQSYALFPHLSIWENVAYGLKVQRLPKTEVLARTDKVLRLMQLDAMQRRFPNQLSGGQQQRVALARAIVIEPAVLLFDEPLSNLDAKLRERMRDELRALQQRLGITSVYVTHDQAEAMAISDRVVVMKDGDLMQMGTPEEIYQYPTSPFVANFIGKANFLRARCTEVRGDGSTQVRSFDRVLTIPDPGQTAPVAGEDCVLAFRPESLQLASQSTDGLPATVTRATYFGDMIEYEVLLEAASDSAATTLTAQITHPQQASRFSVGDQVQAVLDLASVRVLTGEPPASE